MSFNSTHFAEPCFPSIPPKQSSPPDSLMHQEHQYTLAPCSTKIMIPQTAQKGFLRRPCPQLTSLPPTQAPKYYFLCRRHPNISSDPSCTLSSSILRNFQRISYSQNSMLSWNPASGLWWHENKKKSYPPSLIHMQTNPTALSQCIPPSCPPVTWEKSNVSPMPHFHQRWCSLLQHPAQHFLHNPQEMPLTAMYRLYTNPTKPLRHVLDW